jgi:DNA-binding transcriptional regulator YiaG
MNLIPMTLEEKPQQAFGTSSGGILAPARKLVLLVATALPLQGTGSSTGAVEAFQPNASVYDQTNSGIKAAPEIATGSAIMEVRRLSGLTWEQLSALLGVARRSLHFWASGKPLNAPNEERVAKLLACVRMIARGSARETRALLLDPQSDGQIPLDLLSRGEYEPVVARLGVGNRPAGKVYSELSAEARAMRRPLPPENLVGALHDDIVGKKPLKARAARAARAKRKG